MNKLLKTDWILLQTIILMVVLYAWISLLCAIFGIFYHAGIWALWLLICLFLSYKKILIFTFPTKEFLSYILIALTFTLLIAFFTIPTIFSGRDQGSLSEAAMRLSQEHSLIQHTPESNTFFDINERGKALNFPGFFYTANGGLITQFPLPYISFLSGFFGVFNVTGLIIANSILLFTFILSITIVARNYLNNKYTFAFLGILLTSFSIGWFAKFTLSENITSMLLWSALALYLLLKKYPNKITFFTLFLTLSLLLFTRIEGLWFFGIFIFLLLQNANIRIFIKKDIWHNVLLPMTILFTIACTIFIVNLPFIITMLKVFTSSISTESSSSNFFEKTTYLFSIYSLYGLLLPLIITAIASVVSISYKRYRTILLPIVIILPLLFYYIFPHISGDHPWMLRRFVFALLPATILISISFTYYIRPTNLLRRTSKYIILLTLLLLNIPAFFTFITYAENSTLQQQVTTLSQNFNNNDLILIDKNVAGNGWSMITNPMRSLENKHPVYFFNPNDFEKINTTKFNNVFLITSETNKPMYIKEFGHKMIFVKNYTLLVDQLNISKTKTIPVHFPIKEKNSVHGTIYKLNTN
jgi:hypothetical protein